MKTVGSSFPLSQDLHRNVKEIAVSIQGVALDYDAARAVAQLLAEKANGGAMLLAWFDGKSGVGYPQVQECTGTMPGWLAYAKSHGGNLRVNVNHHAFVFIFAVGPAPERG
ncbi:MAG: AF1514 family protein [Sulfuricella sp.]